MKRMSMMVARLYAPAPLLVAGGWLASFAVEQADGALGLAGARHAGSLLALLGTGLGLAWAMLASWRLYVWLRGMEQSRCHCGGLLSRPRRKGHGAAYRKCLACGEKFPLAAVHVPDASSAN